MKPTFQFQSIKTNIITGFLGAGKTSAILHLLTQKPKNERWAILVNEFGEIGVDAQLLNSNSQQNQQSVFIREVAGGCMCCTSNLPMQIALTQLLADSKPDRLLIEPTGLGHPKEVLQVLNSSYYKNTLSIEKTLTLIDARKLHDSRYANNEIFQQQLEIADTIIANKTDLYAAEDEQLLNHYLQQHNNQDKKRLSTEHAHIDIALLDGASCYKITRDQPIASTQSSAWIQQPQLLAADKPLPECGYIKATNENDGYYSIGWRFAGSLCFDYAQLFNLLSGLPALRMKAIFNTDQGTFSYNLAEYGLKEVAYRDCKESRIELIDQQPIDCIESLLLACLKND